MNKLFLSLGLLLFVRTFIYSQDENKLMLGGSLQYITNNQKYINTDWKFVDFSFSPKFGFFINANSLVGLETGISYIKQMDYDGYGYNENTLFNLSAFYRYQNQVINNFNYFIEPNFGRLFIKDSELRYYNIGADFGILYSITNKLNIEIKLAGLDYSIYWYKDSEYKTEEFNIKYDLIQPNLGIKYYF